MAKLQFSLSVHLTPSRIFFLLLASEETTRSCLLDDTNTLPHPLSESLTDPKEGGVPSFSVVCHHAPTMILLRDPSSSPCYSQYLIF